MLSRVLFIGGEHVKARHDACLDCEKLRGPKMSGSRDRPVGGKLQPHTGCDGEEKYCLLRGAGRCAMHLVNMLLERTWVFDRRTVDHVSRL
jgi:hypothetical protein